LKWQYNQFLTFIEKYLNMDSDEDEGNFARQGGQAIDLEGDFDSEEEVDDEMDEDDDEMPQPQ
jgi:hypothetical protein